MQQDQLQADCPETAEPASGRGPRAFVLRHPNLTGFVLTGGVTWLVLTLLA
jgi:hypothetical protein